MQWVMVLVIILAIELIIIAMFWDKITEAVASYPALLAKGEKAYQEGLLEKAKQYYLRVLKNRQFNSLSEDSPLKVIAYKQLGLIFKELAEERLEKKQKDYGVEYFQQAIIHTVKILELNGEWEKLKENHPEMRDLRIKLAKAYFLANYNLQEALELSFSLGQWQLFLDSYSSFKKQNIYFKLADIEKDLLREKATLAEGILLYANGIKKINSGEKGGEKDYDKGLEMVSEVLNTNDSFLRIDETVFNEIKEKLGRIILEEIHQLKDDEEKEAKEKHIEKEKVREIKNNWDKVVGQLQKQSRVVENVALSEGKPGEITITVQTEWYLLPLIFQEELVERVAATYYQMTKKKEGSLFFIFRDNKGREVARHTQLGVRVYN